MSPTPTTAAPPNQSDPHQDRPAAAATPPSRTAGLLGLLGLVRKIIDYGKHWVGTVRERVEADPYEVMSYFRTADVGLILARLTRGLMYAAALEARIAERLAEEANRPATTPGVPSGAPSSAPPPCPSRPRSPRRARLPEDPRIAGLPTAEEIAADVRRRPIGAVLVDICRDLGIYQGHPLWGDVNIAIIQNGATAIPLIKEMFNRLGDYDFSDTMPLYPPMPPDRQPPPRETFAAFSGTGPP